MSNGTRVTLLRHGTTDANQGGLFLGQTDVPLNDTGEREAAALATRMQRDDLDVLVTSDLSRARVTAEHVARACDLELTVDARFREIHLGDFEVLPAKDVHRDHADLIARWVSDPATVRFPGAEAETLAEVQTRALEGLEALVAAHPGRHIGITTHMFTLLTLVCWVTGLELAAFRKFHVDRASITRLQWSRFGPQLRVFNDASHLS